MFKKVINILNKDRDEINKIEKERRNQIEDLETSLKMLQQLCNQEAGR